MAPLFLFLPNGNYAEIRSLQPFKDFSIQLFGKENLLVMIYNGNRISSILIFMFIVFNLFFPKTKSGSNTFLSLSINFLVIFLILITYSRGGFLCLSVICLLLYFANLYKDYKSILRNTFLILGLFSVLLLFDSQSIKKAGQTLIYRVAKTEIKKEIRFITFTTALKNIKSNPWKGFGLGTTAVEIPGKKTKIYIHNFILGSWFMSGILGLMASLAFVFYVLNYSMRKTIILAKSKNPFPQSSIWFIVLPVFLINLMISGYNGNLGLISWSYISILFAYSIRFIK